MNKIAKYTLYVLGVGVTSELILQIVKLYIKRCKRLELNEVLFTTNNSGCCPFPKSPVVKYVANKADCDKYCLSRNLGRLLQLIDSTKSSISLAMYIFTLQELADALLRAKKRGVVVRVIGDQSMAYSTGSKMTQLTTNGIAVRFPINSNMLVHHKFCLLDSKPYSGKPLTAPLAENTVELPKNGVLISGSMNWTNQAISGNWDNIIVTSNDNIVSKFENEFNEMWDKFQIEQK